LRPRAARALRTRGRWAGGAVLDRAARRWSAAPGDLDGDRTTDARPRGVRARVFGTVHAQARRAVARAERGRGRLERPGNLPARRHRGRNHPIGDGARTMTVAPDILDTFHRVLVDEIRRKRPEYLK